MLNKKIIENTLKALSCNIYDNYHPSSTINLCRYLAENCEDEFISTAGDSSLTFSGQMSVVETASLMSDGGLNISQLRILLRILRNKLGVKMFEPENIMKSLSGDMILPKFGEYKYNKRYYGILISDKQMSLLVYQQQTHLARLTLLII